MKVDVVVDARNAGVRLATENGLTVIRADVAGRAGGLVSHGSSSIVAAGGTILLSARPSAEDLLVADLDTTPPLTRIS